LTETVIGYQRLEDTLAAPVGSDSLNEPWVVNAANAKLVNRFVDAWGAGSEAS